MPIGNMASKNKIYCQGNGEQTKEAVNRVSVTDSVLYFPPSFDSVSQCHFLMN